MRIHHWFSGSLVITGLVACVLGAGCNELPADCPDLARCEVGTGGGGGGGGTPSGCVPSENTDAVEDACGIFVSSSAGNDGNAGTKGEPVKTLDEALRRAMQKATRVYACAESFEENVEVPAGMTIFGGLDCSDGWTWIGGTTKTSVMGVADEVAVTLKGGEGTTRIEDVAVKSANAVAAGASSIAVLADGATAELVRCELIAGDGADGEAGAPGVMPAMPGEPVPAAMAGSPGAGGVNACSDLDGVGGPDATLPGGAQVEQMCGGNVSIGGGGGTGNVSSGGPGAPGETGPGGQGGAGEPSVMGSMWDCGAIPGDPNKGGGNAGANGTPGDAGVGASGLGALSSSGYAGVVGGVGTSGKPGQGGGGGGGAKGLASCPAGGPGGGASGGSGGAGGCGGLAGQGGQAGGASIALASVQATVTLTDCTLTAGKGGNGGPGGELQPGGIGGTSGQGGTGVGGSNPGCDGGKGGKGGNGGPGGGGLGGPSAAVAFTGAAVTKAGETTVTPGTAGLGGPGGSNNIATNPGADGTTAAELELP